MIDRVIWRIAKIPNARDGYLPLLLDLIPSEGFSKNPASNPYPIAVLPHSFKQIETLDYSHFIHPPHSGLHFVCPRLLELRVRWIMIFSAFRQNAWLVLSRLWLRGVPHGPLSVLSEWDFRSHAFSTPCFWPGGLNSEYSDPRLRCPVMPSFPCLI